MPVSLPGPSFALSDWSAPGTGGEWAAWQARISAGEIGRRIDPVLAAAIQANEAVVLGRTR